MTGYKPFSKPGGFQSLKEDLIELLVDRALKIIFDARSLYVIFNI